VLEAGGRIALPAIEPTKVWNPIFIRIFIANMFMQMSQFMMNTLTPQYVSHLGASAGVVGIVASMFAVTALGMRIFSGPVTMSFSQKKVAAIAAMGIAAAFCLYGLSTTVPMVIVARLLHGCGMSFTAPAALAIASDTLPRYKLGTGIGYFSIGQAAATALGPGIGLALIPVIGYHRIYFIGALVMVLAAALIFTMKLPEPASRKKFSISLNTIVAREALVPMALILFLTMANNNINAFLVLFAQSRGVSNIGLFFTVYAVVLLVSRALVAPLSDRLGARKIILPAMILFALSMVLIGISTTLPMFLAAAVIYAVGFGSCQPAIQTLCIKSVSPERRGVAGSTNYVGMDIGSLFGPVCAGAIADRYGYAPMFLSLTIPIAVSVVLFCVFRATIRRIDA